jgi:RHS repeat-associated protein
MEYGHGGKPYQVSLITPAGDAVPAREQSLTYTSFQRPATFTENGYNATFTCNGAGERVKMYLAQNSTAVLTRYYIGGQYEIDAQTNTERLYLGGGAYSAPAVYVKEAGNWKIYYICRDYLGSITHVANADGSLKAEYSYDAWGRLRNPTTQVAYTPGSEPALFLGRGYTGHEHLPWFGLVNMNARLYDPALGRFLAPDPYVQMPDFSQSFNRYSYCLNNPLRYTDPTGEWALIDDLIAAVVGGIVNVVVNAIQGNIHSIGQGFALFGVGAAGTWAGLYAGPLAAGAIIGAGNSFVNQGFGAEGKWNWNNINPEQILMSGLMGAGMSYLGGQVSGFIAPHVSQFTSVLGGQAVQQMATQSIVGSATGFVLGTSAALINGESFKDALKAGGQGAALGFTTGTISGLASGMRAAYKAGENPWTGKLKYPSNDGFLGTPETRMLQPGEVVDRYGGTGNNSRFVSPEGTPIDTRSLPNNTNLNLYERYQVVKPFSVQSGVAAPWFGQPGGGIQYNTVIPIQTLIKQGYLIPY